MSMTPAPTPPRHQRAQRRLALVFVGVALLLGLAVAGTWVYVKRLSPTARVQRHQQQATLLLRNKRIDEAIAELESARALAPGDTPLAVRLAMVYAAKGDGARADSLLRDTLASATDKREPALALASLLLADRRGREAYGLLAPLAPSISSMANAEERAGALLTLGQCALAAGGEAAVAAARQAFADAAKASADATTLAQVGRAQLEAGDAAGAETTLGRSLDLDAAGSAAALALAAVLESQGRRPEGVARLEAVAAAGTGALEVGPELVRLYLSEGRAEDAAALTERVAADPNGGGAALDMRATLAESQGDLDGARAQLEQLAERAPGSARPHLRLAQLYAARGEPERARAAAEKALEVQPGLGQAELILVELNLREGKLEAAAARAERLLDEPALRDRAVAALIAIHTRDAEPAEAARKLEALAARAPDDARVRLAVLLLQAGAGADGSLEEIVKLVEASPDLPGGFAALAAAAADSAGALEALDTLARIARKDPRLAGARLVLAREYQRLGRRDLAARELDAALVERSDLHEARLARAALALGGGDIARAETELGALRRALPRNRQVLFLLGDLHLRRGDAVGALEPLAVARELEPGDAGGVIRLGRALAYARRYADAARAFEVAERLRPRLGAACEGGAVRLAEGKAAEARAALQRGYQQSSDPRLLAAAAVAQALEGDPRGALTTLRGYGQRARDPAVLVVEAMLLALAGDPRGAAEVAGRAGVAAPVALAAAGLRAGDPASELRARVGLELFAFRVLGWEFEVMARVHRIAGETRAADALLIWWGALGVAQLGGAIAPEPHLAIARRLAELCPDDAGAGLALAEAEVRAGAPERELATLRDLRARQPDDARVALRLGDALERSGDLDGAFEAYEAAANASDPSPIALNNYAYHLARKPERRASAIDYARRAWRAAPQFGEIADTLGWLLFLEGRADEATPVLEQAAARAPANPTVRYHLGRALASGGSVRRAVAHLEMALVASEGAAASVFPEREEATRLLEELRAEQAAARAALDATGSVRALGLGASDTMPLAAGQVAAWRIPGGAASEVSLSIEAADTDFAAGLFVAGRAVKRFDGERGRALALPRLAVGPEGYALVVRARAAGRVTLGLAAAKPPEAGWEREPEAARGEPIEAAGADGGRAGAFDGQSDEDTLALAIPAGGAIDVDLVAGPHGAMRAMLVERRGNADTVRRSALVAAGATGTWAGLYAPEGASLLLRLSPASTLARPASGAAGATWDYRVAVRPAAKAGGADREPNDRLVDAGKLAFPGTVEGTAGPYDSADWYAVDAAPGALVSIAAKRSALEEPFGVELWEQRGTNVRLVRRYVGAREPIAVERWRTPADGTLVVAVGPAGGATSTLAYTLSVTPSAPVAGAETEPNDAWTSAESLAIGGTLSGRLDGTDRDWARLEGAGGRVVRLRFEAEKPAADVLLLVVADPGKRPERVAGYRTRGGRVEVPALRLPAEAIAALASGLGVSAEPYRLTLEEAAPTAGAEVEPNDDALTAMPLESGRPLSGMLSGLDDTDLVRGAPGKAMTVEATGDAAISVRVVGEDVEDRVVKPGAPLRVAPTARGLVELRAAWGSSAEGAKQATYRIAAAE